MTPFPDASIALSNLFSLKNRSFELGNFSKMKFVVYVSSNIFVYSVLIQADNFKIYSEYCSNHSNSVELLVKLTKNGEVNASLRVNPFFRLIIVVIAVV